MAVATAPTGATDAGAGYELLGVLLMAHVLGASDLAMDEVRRFDVSPGVVQSNSVTFTEADGGIVVRADVRGGCETFRPTVGLLRRDLPDTVAKALPGRRLGDVVGGWLSHPDLVVDSVEVRPNGETTIHVVPTALDADAAVAAIASMREELAGTTHPGDDGDAMA